MRARLLSTAALACIACGVALLPAGCGDGLPKDNSNFQAPPAPPPPGGGGGGKAKSAGSAGGPKAEPPKPIGQ